ncbi:MAG: methyltransferase [Lysobacterales bacterium CG17_big_fil_post_rev_8_21_14_2_50_64_11]|nr:MAG: methyltransferase [Xanthomonadales bacterium CG17_big_fil_post_rev_8_21_14_2_50_64_11]PIX59555.1 MAG: methyltransferase [Xanthomonadales bacterium CG_4_10_14_3_um_filter_64_11]
MSASAKRYDRDYFDRWYRKRTIQAPGVLARKAALAVAAAEYALDRPLRSVIDVGCGEGRWRAALHAIRPGIEYLGIDSSDYAVRRYGRSRNLRLARFGQLDCLRFGPSADLLVCSDVLHYLPGAELKRGLRGFAEMCHGVAFIEAFCRGDAIEGDLDGYIARPASFYRRALSAAGFHAAGAPMWLAPAVAAEAMALERA